MSITPAELWQKITSYSLALPDQCRQWANDIAKTQGAAAALQTDQIVNYLRDQNLLSQYQLDQLTNSAEPLLKIGPWRIEDRVQPSPFSQWFLGNDVARNRKRWLFILDDTLLQQPEVRQAGPSLEWNKIHSALKLTDGLNFEPPEKHGSQLLLCALPLEGSLIQPKDISPNVAAQYILQLARTLNELHQNRMVHGNVRPDRLWINPQGTATLLRDPIVPPNAPSTTDPWSPLDRQLAPASCVHFLAPELSVPGQIWTPAADIYSLGCLWYWLVTGSAPFQSSPLNQVAVQHAVSQLYASENDLGGKHLAECFKFCVAKNPSSRFSQAGALIAALEVALAKVAVSVIATPPVLPKPEIKTEIKTEAKAQPKPEPPKPELPKPAEIKTETPPVTAPKVEAPKPTAPQPKPAKPEQPKPQPAKVELPKVEPTKPVPPKPELTKPEPQKSQPPKTELPKPAPPKTEPTKPAPIQQALSKPEPAKVEPTKIEVSKPEPTPAPAVEEKVAPKPAAQPAASVPPPAPTALAQPTVPQPAVAPTALAPTALAPTALAQPTVPQPTVPQPTVPQPTVPQPTVPQPTVPQPAVVQPAVPTEPPAPRAPKAELPASPPKTEPVKPPQQTTEPTKKKTSKKKSTGTGEKKKKKSSKARPAWIMPTIAVGSLLFMAIVLVILTQFTGNNPAEKPSPPTIAANTPDNATESTESGTTTKPAPRDAVHDKFTVISDDKTLPWAPPTSGDPFSLEMLPPEAQVWMYWKPAKFAQDPQGAQLLSVLEADSTPGTEYLTSRAGTTLDNLNDVLIAFYPGKEGKPEIAIRFTLNTELPLTELKAKWGNVQEAKSGKSTIFTNDRSEAYFITLDALASDQKVKTFTVGPQKRIDELVALDGGLPPLRRQLEQLHRRTDANADLTILFAPGFLFTDGRQILSTSVPALREPLAQILATDMQAGMLTTTLKPNWYVEVRLVGNADQDASRIATDLNQRFTNLPDEIESRTIAGTFDSSWGKLSLRYPQMLRELLKHLRVNVEDGQAIANFYLPKVAAPNLIVASWLAAHSDSAKTLVANNNEPTDQPTITPDQFLDRPIKLAFDQESLEIALQSIAEATADGLPASQPKLAMELDYSSMEKDGITQNQQIRQFMHNGKPLREVLTELVKRANPTPGIQDTTSAEMKFVWILVDAADKPGGKKVLLTTRAYVADKKLTLSKEFAMP
jgi:serine/threonine protein kinase